MRLSQRSQRAALFLNLLGAVVLFLSFQATSSDFKIVVTKGVDGNGDSKLFGYGVCVGKDMVMYANPNSGIVGWGGTKCVGFSSRSVHPVAIVTSENRWFAAIGFLLTAAGFLIQYLATSGPPKTIAELRKEIKLQKFKEKQNASKIM